MFRRDSRSWRSRRRTRESSHPELLHGYNYSKGHIPRVGPGSARQGLFESQASPSPRAPIFHIGILVALVGAILANVAFFLLLPWVDFAIGGGILVFFVIRGFIRCSTSDGPSISERDKVE